MKNYYDKQTIETLLQGYWYRAPQNNWQADNVCIAHGQVKMEKDKRVLFIAMDSDTWHKGSKNKNYYAGWKDTHQLLPSIEKKLSGVITQRPVEDLSIPQFIVENTYEAIGILGSYAFQQFLGKTIGVTGTAGKSTVKNMLKYLLEKHKDQVVATRGNHNTRTGVPLTVACSITKPDYLIIESAISGLWTKPHGIMKHFPPDIAIITSIDGGQQKSAMDTAILKTKICEGMSKEGIVVLNKDMLHYDTVHKNVLQYTNHIITYSLEENADSSLLSVQHHHGLVTVNAKILGEEVSFETSLLTNGMISNIIGVLTILKLCDVDLQSILPSVALYKPVNNVLQFETLQKKDGTSFTFLNDSWNATGIAMIEVIRAFKHQAKFYKGKKIAVLGRVENLSEEEAYRQHHVLAKEIIDAKFDLVFAHGPETKFFLKELPEDKIGGYFENAKEMMSQVVNRIEEDDVILLKGSPRMSDFSEAAEYLMTSLENSQIPPKYLTKHPYATGKAVATFEASTGEVAYQFGDIHGYHNQGLGHIFLLEHVLNLVFAKKLSLANMYTPGRQALKEIKSLNSIPIYKEDKVTLLNLLEAGIVNSSPNALIMLANQVIGSNKKTMNIIKKHSFKAEVSSEAIKNITGRRISNLAQKTTLRDMFHAGKWLLGLYPSQFDQLARTSFIFKDKFYETKTNLFQEGLITHGIFFGYLDSMAIAFSKINGKQYITVCYGCMDAFERDSLLAKSILHVSKPKKSVSIKKREVKSEQLTINFLGDTYFGEFYTKIRQRQGKKDALSTKGRNYSFDGIRNLFPESNLNICNFEGALSMDSNDKLKQAKPFVLHADPKETVEALKEENFHLATLANNHAMDCGKQGLQMTLTMFEKYGIDTMGAGKSQTEAEQKYIIETKKRRIAIFNGYWYRHRMYRHYDFYAVGDSEGVSCLSGGLLDAIEEERRMYPESHIILIAHWGVDFQQVRPLQRQYAQRYVDAGVDLIVGHGAHTIQEIEKYKHGTIFYSIGNGVFNSNGEYQKRFVPAYGFILRLNLETEKVVHQIYPIFTDNLKTFWQPQLLNDQQIEHCKSYLKQISSLQIQLQKDNEGQYYFLI
ncbi:CapA family protein [Ornithinibacillus sp. 4-3]|uniref:CapA family protein n=1 Tax=Ornithinibacillus sp. 4-3 TaxID=3231488 RepID=A0AB39HI54_9BACI